MRNRATGRVLLMIYDIIVNSARTKEKQIAAVLDVFEGAGKQVAIHHTKERGHAKK